MGFGLDHFRPPLPRTVTARECLGDTLDYARRLTNILQEFSLPLLVGVIAGLVMANVSGDNYSDIVHYDVFGEGTAVLGHELDVLFLINGIFMVFFFGIATKEITESVLPGGALNPVPKAINPLMGTLGGVLGPAGLYILLAHIFYGGTDDLSEVRNGWGIPTATDIALAWLVARMVFGNGHPAVNFLLLLAVADDAIGLGIIAIVYPDPENPVQPAWLLLTLGGMAAAYGMRRFHVGFWPIYILIAGGLSWAGLAKSAIEPALALVVIVPFLPGPQRDPGLSLEESGHETAVPQAPAGNHDTLHPTPAGNPSNPAPETAIHAEHHVVSPLEQFEHQLKLFVDLGLFFFGFANAGVALGSINKVTFLVLVSLVAGKTFGVFLFSWIASNLGFPLPTGMKMKHLLVSGMIAGLGLTVALFVAAKAFPDSPFLDPAKMGAVLSVFVAVLAFATGYLLKVKDGAGTGGENR